MTAREFAKGSAESLNLIAQLKSALADARDVLGRKRGRYASKWSQVKSV